MTTHRTPPSEVDWWFAVLLVTAVLLGLLWIGVNW